MSDRPESRTTGASRRGLLKGLALGGVAGAAGFAGGVAYDGSVLETKLANRAERYYRQARLAAIRFGRDEPLAGRPLRVGVIGSGSRGGLLATILARYPASASIVALCDLYPERMEAVDRDLGLGATHYADYRRLLDEANVDLVVIATHNSAHVEPAIMALRQGVHVFLEKPMATRLDDCARLEAAAAESMAKLQVGLEFRYAPLYQALKEMVEGGVIGRVRAVVAEELRSDWVRFWPDDPEKEKRLNWRYYLETSGGSILEKLCHDLDIHGWVLGQPAVSIAATGGKAVYTDRETIDHANMCVTYADGARFMMHFSLFAPTRVDTRYIGETGTLEFQRGGSRVTIVRGTGNRTEEETLDIETYTSDPYGHYGTEDSLLALFTAIRDDTPPWPSVREATECVRQSLAAQESVARGGQPIAL